MKLLIVLCLLVSGCATADTVGSKPWLKAKKTEYEQAYKDGKIDYYQYQDLISKAEQSHASVVAGILSRNYQPMQSGSNRPTVIVQDYD